MTYNIQAGGVALDSVAAVIRGARADVVALQEVDVHWSERSQFVDQADSLASLLGMQARFAPIYTLPGNAAGDPPRQYGVAFLSRLPIASFTNHTLTRHSTLTTTATPEPMPGFLEAIVRVGGTSVRVFSTHLDYRGDPTVRRQQVAETMRILGDDARPIVLCGDFNAVPTAPELTPLRTRLHDAWPDSSGAGFTYPAERPVRRIDYVMLSSHFQVLEARVLDTQASDHRPVLVTLLFR
jgi:endonuclease/exonuclease/phosphatase family metal-dependent hydrolase